jgi:hypothetical protein
LAFSLVMSRLGPADTHWCLHGTRWAPARPMSANLRSGTSSPGCGPLSQPFSRPCGSSSATAQSPLSHEARPTCHFSYRDSPQSQFLPAHLMSIAVRARGDIRPSRWRQPTVPAPTDVRLRATSTQMTPSLLAAQLPPRVVKPSAAGGRPAFAVAHRKR